MAALLALVREEPGPYPAPGSQLTVDPLAQPALSEEALVHLWQGQRFPSEALTTREGVRLRIIYRGRRFAGPGPDFRDAIIATSIELLKGDVELHVRASDFRRHGHHLDGAYDTLALHVVFWDDEGQDTLLACGRRVPVVALAPWVARRTLELRFWLSQPPLWVEPCQGALDRLGKKRVTEALDKLGDMRFRQKVAALAKAMSQEDPEEVLYRGILEALGYQQNREPFRLLAQRLPWRALRRALLQVPPGQRLLLAKDLMGKAAEAPPPLPWRNTNLRPENRPARRLLGAAGLLARHGEKGLLATFNLAISGGTPRPLLEALTVYEKGRALVGASRAGEIAINVLLPVAVAWGEKRADHQLVLAAEGLYRRFPRPSSYGLTRHLDRAVGGKGGITIDARRQQGMLYLYGQYCTQGGCGRCPLS